MQNENHNNWKQKLEELDSLPGESLHDKNASWEKLYARIGGKKQSKKAVWYWAAAACILFALMMPIAILNKKTHQVDSVTIEQKPPEIKIPGTTMIDKKDSVKNISPVLPEKNEIRVAGRFNKAENKIITGKEINKIRLSDTVSTQNLVAEDNNNPLQAIDTSSGLTAIIPVKKKLKVVQINELGDPEESQPETVRNSYKHTIQFKFGNQEIFNSPLLVSTEKGFTILKIKTSTN